MTMAELRSAATWLKVLDQAKDWRQSFEDDKHAKKNPFIGFGDISGWDALADERSGSGWDGTLMMPRRLAIDMMMWLEARARRELKKLGVEP